MRSTVCNTLIVTVVSLISVSVPRPTPAASAETVQIVDLRTEFRTNPLGIDALRPRLSWKLRSAARDVRQSAYRVRVAASVSALFEGKALEFDSGRVESDQSTQLAYSGPPVQSRRRYVWQVRVWDAKGRASGWSAPASWEMGLLTAEDWTASWIDPGFPEDPETSGPAAMVRAPFLIDGRIVKARAYVTSLGLYELYLNGKRVGDQLLTPGWTSYGKRIQYQTYDVTRQLRSGANTIGATLGDGWYRGTLVDKRKRHHFGDRVALLAQVEVTYADGRTQTVRSDTGWRAATGPILYSDLYNGERYDARLERANWSSAGYDDRSWSAVKVMAAPAALLIAAAGPPIRRIQELKPVRILETPAGTVVADMGQNMVGWVRLRVTGPAGTTVTLRHAEILDRAGNFYTDNLRTADQKIQYTLKGGAEEIFEPHFTFQGFRYVAVEGYPGKLTPGSLTGIVIHSAMPPTGSFDTSEPLVNQLQHNIVWGQKGNFVGVPTDCPQRDERLGWTGDAQAFSATAAFNLDVDGFFTKWLADLSADQTAAGAVPWIVPDVLHKFKLEKNGTSKEIDAAGAAGWSDAATIIPWNLYLAYGDAGILARQYQSMSRWVAYQEAQAVAYIWTPQFQFGDWLDFFSTSRNTNFGSTADDLIATAYFGHSVDILQRSAVVLGKPQDASRYAELLDHIRKAFVQKFVAADGTVGQGTQTAYVLALDFDLVPQELRAAAARHLADDVRARGHLTTGFLGTPHLLNVLSRFGYLGEAYRLLDRREFPSWLYPVTRGATTIWERWDGIKPDGTFQDVSMNSFNHYAYGAVGEWMYTVIAGINIDPAAPGYRHSLIQPQPGGRFTRAVASLETAYGKLSSGWEIKEDRFNLTIEVPANTRATVRLPKAVKAQVSEGRGTPEGSQSMQEARQEGDAVTVSVGSGQYQFSYPWRAN